MREAVVSMASNKTPGGYGPSSEFFKLFWEIIKGEVVKVIKYIMKKGYWSKSMRKGIVVFIFKRGDRKDVRNRRPISFLNTDHKVFAKVIARRLSKMVGKMVSETKTCAVHERMITENLILIRDIIKS